LTISLFYVQDSAQYVATSLVNPLTPELNASA
jgi:hypothetical protein